MMERNQKVDTHQKDLTVSVREDKKFCKSKGRSQSKFNGFFEAFKSQDIFGESFHMKIDGRYSALSTWMGALCTLLIFIIIGLNTYLKVVTLLSRKDVNIVQVLHANYHSEEFEFGYEDGFNVAFALTKYDNEVERILDPSYGELKI